MKKRYLVREQPFIPMDSGIEFFKVADGFLPDGRPYMKAPVDRTEEVWCTEEEFIKRAGRPPTDSDIWMEDPESARKKRLEEEFHPYRVPRSLL